MQLKRYEMSGKESVFALIDLIAPHHTFELYEAVDESILLAAVKEAICRHPLFGTRIIFENNTFYFEQNPKPPVIFTRENAPKIYGTEENNHYPWMIVLRDKQLLFYASHTLADGAGMFSFCKTFLHLYFQRSGVVFAEAAADFPAGSPAQTTENAFSRYADPACKAFGTPKFSPPVEVKPDWFERSDRQPWRLEIPLSEVRRFSKQSETSVFSVIACILSRAMADAFGIQSGNINVRVPVNLRSAFPSATDRNFVQGFSLCYMTDRMAKMPDARIETAFRSQLDLWTDRDNLMQIINADIDLAGRAKAAPGEFRAALVREMQKQPGAVILYTHITRPDFSEELMKHIRDIRVTVSADEIREGLICVTGLTVGPTVCLTVQQCSKNDCFTASLRKVLDRREIAYKLYPIDLPPVYTCRSTSDLIYE
ncbi:MAG: hypothetical protein MJ102_08800 [Clostridia bacterium]|nr:hypothetical protein [Clostridia bacterium]